MEQVADDYKNLGKQVRFSKKCIPRGYIPDFNWTKIHKGRDQPIKPIQQQDPTEDATTPAAATEVEGPPSSHLVSKTKAAVERQRARTTGTQSSSAGTTRMQSSSNRGQHSGNCTHTLLLGAMDLNSLMGQESL